MKKSFHLALQWVWNHGIVCLTDAGVADGKPDQETTMIECGFCGRQEDIMEASDGGWYPVDVQIGGDQPRTLFVCPDCGEAHVVQDADGEYQLA